MHARGRPAAQGTAHPAEHHLKEKGPLSSSSSIPPQSAFPSSPPSQSTERPTDLWALHPFRAYHDETHCAHAGHIMMRPIMMRPAS